MPRFGQTVVLDGVKQRNLTFDIGHIFKYAQLSSKLREKRDGAGGERGKTAHIFRYVLC